MANRQAWIDAARSYVGLEPSDASYVDRVYLDHVERPTDLQKAQARQMAREQSGCGLVWEAIARDVGATGPWEYLRRWYGEPSRIGGVIRDMVATAKKAGAWRRPGQGMPQPGDAVVIGGPAPEWSRDSLVAEHVLLVTSADGAELHSIDGGQPGVAERTRILVQTPQGELWLADRASGVGPDGRPTKGRRVQGWIDAPSIETAGGAGAGSPFPGGGASGGGGSSGGWACPAPSGSECPPCPPGGGGGFALRGGPWGAVELLLLAYLLGELSGQAVEEGGRRRRRRG